MSRGTWVLQTKTLGGAWGSNTTINRPNDSIGLTTRSTQSKITLADGSDGYFTPSTKSLTEPLVFVWYADDGTIKTQVEGYITNQTNIKITDQNSNVYIGRFTILEGTEIVGKATAEYDLRATFERMPNL